MREMNSLELICLIKELGVIEEFYIDQFYQVDENKFRFKLSKKGEKANMQCILPIALYRTEVLEIKESASNFSIAVRNRINGYKIKKISQFNSDRIILINLEKGELKINIIFEMFGKGNLVLTDNEMKILLAYKVHEFKDRSVKPNATYMQPKSSSVNILDRKSVESVVKGMKGKDIQTNVAAYLVKRIGIGSIYIEEALSRAGFGQSTKVNELNDKELDSLANSINEIINECLNKPIFLAYKKESTIFDFSLCRTSKHSGIETEEFNSFESILDIGYQNAEIIVEEKNEEAEKTKASIEKQKEFLKDIDKEIAENKRAGTYLINNMHEINKLVQEARSKKNPKPEELQSIANNIEVLSINMKNKSMKIKIKDDSDA